MNQPKLKRHLVIDTPPIGERIIQTLAKVGGILSILGLVSCVVAYAMGFGR